jgi:nifR3 family TIM-barrel protein
MNIGKIKLENNLILAPLHGVSCVAFRLLCRKHGASLAYTPLVHPESIFNEQSKLDVIDEERPVSIQLVGKDPNDMAKAAQIIEPKADIIDINLGCPDQQVLAKKAGAFLIKHPEQMEKMVSKVVGAVNCPVTAKIRIGWDDKSINALEVAKTLENLGIDAIAVHGRTRKQVYAGKANWNIIKQVKEKANIPIIGNGDIFKPENYKAMLEKTGVDAVMIGRGAIGNPQLFRNCLSKGKLIKKDIQLSYDLFKEFMDYYNKYSIRYIFPEVRQHAMWFAKGIKQGARIKKEISECDNIEQINKLFKKEL